MNTGSRCVIAPHDWTHLADEGVGPFGDRRPVAEVAALPLLRGIDAAEHGHCDRVEKVITNLDALPGSGG